MKQITMNGNPLTLAGSQPKIGDNAPNFTVTATNLGDVNLTDFKGKTIVLSVFPSIDTDVCAMQTKKFYEKTVELNKDIVILSISKDLPFALNRFCAAEGLEQAITLSDYKTNDFGLKYGFLINELQLLARGVVVIDKNNVIQHIEYVAEMTNEPDYTAALDVVNKIM